jgi:hypothetical protein
MMAFPNSISGLAIVCSLALAGCRGATPTPQLADIQVTFDMGGGGSGFAASLFAQEVTTGETFKGFYPAGSHGLVVMPTSAPILISVEAGPTCSCYADRSAGRLPVRRHWCAVDRLRLQRLAGHRRGSRRISRDDR